MGVPQNGWYGWFIRENTKKNWWFRGTPIYGNLQIQNFWGFGWYIKSEWATAGWKDWRDLICEPKSLGMWTVETQAEMARHFGHVGFADLDHSVWRSWNGTWPHWGNWRWHCWWTPHERWSSKDSWKGIFEEAQENHGKPWKTAPF